MNLRFKFIAWTATVIGSVAFLGGVSLWNLSVQSRAMQTATTEFDVADRAGALAFQVAWLRDSLRTDAGNTFRDIKYFLPLQTQVKEILRETSTASELDAGDASAEVELGNAISTHLEKAVNQATATTPSSNSTPNDSATELDHVHEVLIAAAKLGPNAARRHVLAVTAQSHTRLLWASLWMLVVVIVSGIVHYKQYRVLVKPLLKLRDDMRTSAATEYRDPVRSVGDPEFKEMALYFNGLAKELAELYRNLEEKVIARSRELVRSERLASVGFLAAGVAHEINNPLSVISGYAELASKNLRDVLTGPDNNDERTAEVEAAALSSVLEAQSIIREESFRCKEITSRLLSLARGGTDNREPLNLSRVAQQVAALIKGLKNYRNHRITLDLTENDSLEVVANLTEMKQVLLNLTINALEASPPDRGEVCIGGSRSGDWVELFVEDNGKGMSIETMEHIFEPFFTAKRGAGEPGTGLGLSITHAIIENHGGVIRAESRGVGRGSRFIIRLPAMEKHRNGTARLAAARG